MNKEDRQHAINLAILQAIGRHITSGGESSSIPRKGLSLARLRETVERAQRESVD